MGGRLEPTDRFAPWSLHFAAETWAANVPGLTMFDHTGTRVRWHRIGVDGDRVCWFATHREGRPA